MRTMIGKTGRLNPRAASPAATRRSGWRSGPTNRSPRIPGPSNRRIFQCRRIALPPPRLRPQPRRNLRPPAIRGRGGARRVQRGLRVGGVDPGDHPRVGVGGGGLERFAGGGNGAILLAPDHFGNRLAQFAEGKSGLGVHATTPGRRRLRYDRTHLMASCPQVQKEMREGRRPPRSGVRQLRQQPCRTRGRLVEVAGSCRNGNGNAMKTKEITEGLRCGPGSSRAARNSRHRFPAPRVPRRAARRLCGGQAAAPLSAWSAADCTQSYPQSCQDAARAFRPSASSARVAISMRLCNSLRKTRRSRSFGIGGRNSTMIVPGCLRKALRDQ